MKRIILACVFVLLGILPLAAQDPSEQYWYGFNSYNTYQVGSFESVNLDNFNLVLHIPIVSYPQRGTLPNLSILVGYGPTTWYQKLIVLQDGSSYYRWTPVENVVSAPYLYTNVQYYQGYRQFEYPGIGTYYEYYISGPDKSIHNLGSTSAGLVAIDGSGWIGTTKDGITYGGNPTYASDPTGNSITLAQSGNYALIDSVGRRVPLGPAVTGPGSYPVTYPGINGGTYSVTYVYANYNISTTFGDPYTNEYTGSATLLQSINLPNGAKWTFSYNNFGDVSTVSTPTGGSVSYTWTKVDVTGGQTFSTFARVLATRAVNANDGTGARTWTYGAVKPGGSNGTAYSGFTDPDGNITAYTTMIRPDPQSLPTATTKQFYQFTATGQAQTLLKTTYTNYTYGYSPFCGRAAGADDDPGLTNFLPQYTTTTLPNGQGTLVSQVTFTYDSGATFSDPNPPATIQAWCGSTTNSYPLVYGSMLQKQETDYGSGAPGSVLRNGVTQYEWQTNSSYLSHGMLNRPASVTIYDSTNNTCRGQSNPCAQTTYAYDETANGSSCTTLPCGNLTSETHWLSTGGSPKTQYVYNAQGMRTKKCDPIDTSCANPTVYTYDSSGMFLSEIQYPTTGSTTHAEFFNYDLNTGQLNWHKDQNNQQTGYSYDSMWRLHAISYPDTGSETYTYNDTVSYPNSPSFTYTRKITSSINFAETGIVDGLGRPITNKTTVPTSTCPAGYSYVSTTYDNEGRKFSVSNPYCTTSDTTYGVTKTYYDMLSRPCLVVPPDGTAPSSYSCPASSPGNDVLTTYSANCTTATDQASKGRSSCADALGRLAKILEDPGSSPHLNYETDYGYDALGNLASVNQGGLQRSFVYDSLSRVVSASNPESGTVCYATYSGGACQNQGGYDANGNLITKTDARGVTINYSYDALDRLTQKAYSGTTISYVYDATSPPCTIPGSFSYGGYPKPRRTAMCDAAGNEAWNYDQMGRALIDQRTTNSVTKSTTYGYNLDGSVASLSYPSNRTLTYTISGAAQLITAVDTAYGINYLVGPTTCPNGQTASGACYTPMGSLAAVKNGSTIITTSFYDKRLQPCRMAVNAAGTGMPTTCADSTHSGDALDFTYNFNLGVSDNGNVYKITNSRTNASDRNINYTYDSLNRIYQAYTDGNLWGETFTTDQWGNMHAIGPYGSKPAGETLNQGVNGSNQFTGVCTGTCYDAAGNMINDGTNSYTYDAENQIATVDSSLSYYYDGNGKRVEKSNGKLYWYGMSSDALDETDLSGNTNNSNFSEYVFFAGKRIARRDYSGDIFYYFADHLGTSRSIVQQGQTTPCYDQDFYPYGREVPHGLEVPAFVNTCSQNYKFTGKERDLESGLDDFGARYYSSQYGRFMTTDEFKGGPIDLYGVQDPPGPLPYADIWNPQSLNKYAYTYNAPLRYIDPDGHCAEDACVLETAAIGTAAVVFTSATIQFYRQNPDAGAALAAGANAAQQSLSNAVSKISGLFFSKDAEAGQLQAAGKDAIDNASATIEKASQDIASFKNPTDVTAHIEGLKDGIKEVKDLSNQLDKTKGKDARSAVKEKLKEAIDQLKGHTKDTQQKPKEKHDD